MAAVANVAINVDSRGAVGKLRQVADSSKQVEKAVQGMNGQLQNSRGSFGNLAQGVLKLAAAYATLNAAQSAVSAGIQRIESERRIQFLAKQYGEVDQLARAAADASDRFGQSQTSANRALADVYARLRPVGVSLGNIVSVYNGFNTAARISGSTAVEAENAFRQLSQALGSGALRGDEFNSIAEQVPGILTAISQETGVAQGKLREYAADGKITADVVIAALQRIEKDGADQLAEALGGPEQAIKDFQNASEDVQVALTTAIVPEMARAFRDLAAIIVGLEPAIRYIGGLIADTLGSFRTLVESIRGGPVVERLRQGGQLGFNVGQEKEQLRSFFGKERFKQLEQQARQTADATMTPFAEALGDRLRVAIKVADRAKEIEARQAARIPTRPFRVGDVIDESTVAGGKVGGGRSAESIAKEQQRAADAARRQAEAIAKGRLESEQLLERLKMQLAIEQEISPIKKIQLQNALEQLEITQRYGNLIAEEEDDLRRNNLERAGALELQVANVRQTEDLKQKIEGAGNSMGKFLAEQMKVKKEATELDQAFQDIGSTISSGIVDTISAAVDGTKSLGDVANNVLRDIANTLLRFGLNTLTSGLAGNDGVGFFSKLFGGGRASGGTVRGGTSYLVGERGPELFTPNRSGSIAPNAAMGGSTIVVNVNSSGSQAQGGDQNAKQLGQAIGAAVQAELIKQKRPGGLLAS